jgi:isopentenyl diphosphate isomerase/L-lactate dehydrogenase-like FMN-dependent dehydrogenase
MLQREIEAAMAICGCQIVTDINKTIVARHPSGAGRVEKYVRSRL